MGPKRLGKRKRVPPRDAIGDSLRKAHERLVRKRLKSAKSEEDAERILEAATAELRDSLVKTLGEAATRMADELDRRRNRLIKERRQQEAGFERRLQRTWAEGLDRLEALLHAFLEFGAMYYKDGIQAGVEESPALFKALSSLHARSCRVGGEITRLLRSGYADGAHARWRTLHEVAVVAQFLGKHGNLMAERYLLHDGVRACRAAERYAQHSVALGWDPIGESELRALRARRDALIKRFGKPFGGDFGWAAEQLEEGSPGVGHLESDINLAHWRPFYGWASDPVHAGPGGLQTMGARHLGKNHLLAGASNAGLADPGQYAALSMAQVLSALVVHRRENLTYFTMYMAFNEEVKRCQAALFLAHRSVEERTTRNLERLARPKRRKPKGRTSKPAQRSR